MKTLLLASLVCLPAYGFAHGDETAVEEEVVIERDAGGARGQKRKERREQKLERRHQPPHPGMHRPSPEEEKAIKRAMELQKETRDISREIRGGAAAKRKDLEKLVAELFDARMKLSEMRLERHKEQAAKLERQISARKAKRDELIKERVEQLSGDQDEMEW